MSRILDEKKSINRQTITIRVICHDNHILLSRCEGLMEELDIKKLVIKMIAELKELNKHVARISEDISCINENIRKDDEYES